MVHGSSTNFYLETRNKNLKKQHFNFQSRNLFAFKEIISINHSNFRNKYVLLVFGMKIHKTVKISQLNFPAKAKRFDAKIIRNRSVNGNIFSR